MKFKNVLFISGIIMVASCNPVFLDPDGGESAACEVDNDCEDSEVCNSDLVCEEIDCRGNDRNCGDGQVCNDDDKCVDADEPADCSDDDNCDADEFCNSDDCCEELDCRADEDIEDHQCVPEDVDNGCNGDDRNCRSDEFCNSNDVCQDLDCDADEDIVNHQCVDDGGNNGCNGDDDNCAADEFCNSNDVCQDLNCDADEDIEDHQCVPEDVVNPPAGATLIISATAQGGSVQDEVRLNGMTIVQDVVEPAGGRSTLCGTGPFERIDDVNSTASITTSIALPSDWKAVRANVEFVRTGQAIQDLCSGFRESAAIVGTVSANINGNAVQGVITSRRFTLNGNTNFGCDLTFYRSTSARDNDNDIDCRD